MGLPRLTREATMPEPFKTFFNPDMIKKMGQHLSRNSPDFDKARFVHLATDGLEALELKERSDHILSALESTLPEQFGQACDLLVRALHPVDAATLSDQTMDDDGIRGWAIMPMADYVARHGMAHFDASMDVLKEMTKRFSAEFAVRPFIDAEPDRAMSHLMKWTKDANVHVRRLASEGCRPRLPWGMRLSKLVEDPAPILPVLEQLRDDPEEYVRRSVANNLNDIAKDHPDLVSRIARDWLSGDADPARKKLVRHACRSLIKQGHPPTLEVFGFGKPKIEEPTLQLSERHISVGQSIGMKSVIRSKSDKPQTMVIDYVVHFQMAKGKSSKKVFKWKTVTLDPNSDITIKKTHSFKPITTRRYYGGTHAIELQINGQTFGRAEFELEAR